mgnify:CR=1 FL=1
MPGTRVHQIINPEGEIYTIDTISPRSSFYGPYWDAICHSQNEKCPIRARIGNSKHSRTGEHSGYTVRVGNVPCFLPASRGGVGFDGQAAREVHVRVISIDPNNRQIVVERAFEADPEWNAGNRRLRSAVEKRRPIRARIVRLMRNRNDNPAGLLARSDGQDIFVPASMSMQVVTFPEESLANLPILVVVTEWNEGRREFIGSIEEAYRHTSRGAPAPSVNSVSVGLSLIVDGDILTVLLPGNCLGYIDANTIVNVPAESRTELCGTTIKCFVTSEIRGAFPRSFRVKLVV